MKPLIDRIVLALCLVFVVLTIVTVSSAAEFTAPQEQLAAELTALQRKNEVLKQEHEALEEWVDEELAPWTEEVAEIVEKGTKAPGSPSPAILPSLPPVPSEVPSPEPSLVPTPTPSVDLGPSVVPTPEPTPSICLPIICEGSASP